MCLRKQWRVAQVLTWALPPTGLTLVEFLGPGISLQPGLDLAVVAIWELNQGMEVQSFFLTVTVTFKSINHLKILLAVAEEDLDLVFFLIQKVKRLDGRGSFGRRHHVGNHFSGFF